MEVTPRTGAGARQRPPARGSRPGGLHRDPLPHRGPFLRGAPPVRARPWPTLLALAGLVLVALIASSLLGENGWRSHQRLRRERAALAAEVDSLRQRQRDMIRRIKELHDPAALERLAREKYGMRAPGEEIIEVVGEENLEGKVPVAPPPGDRPKLGTAAPPGGKRAAATSGKATATTSGKAATTTSGKATTTTSGKATAAAAGKPAARPAARKGVTPARPATAAAAAARAAQTGGRQP